MKRNQEILLLSTLIILTSMAMNMQASDCHEKREELPVPEITTELKKESNPTLIEFNSVEEIGCLDVSFIPFIACVCCWSSYVGREYDFYVSKEKNE